ncbi:protein-disulfide reductase DsbD domain-containing protein [Oceaniglobus indicus]|uniref:protein-disulfide reductase DsbD domain-containing protein n=1 Tax=Oceaniglobus indicus TaxID=2047749 RepID=UPI000C19FA7C|nr:protein-disulfide reductase DsbD domain-containing protein [Oceaniglobus indicus]
MNRSSLALAATLAAAVPFSLQAAGDPARLDVLPGWRTDRGTVIAAIRIQLDPGWKTYWRTPGDAGIPPQFSWAGSSNLASVALHWPIPETFGSNGYTSIGYHDQLILPIELTPRDPARPIGLRGQADIGVCADICVPFSSGFSANLAADAGRRDARIVANLAARPISARAAQVSAVHCDLTAQDGQYALRADVTMPSAGRDEHAVIELPGQPVWVSQAETARSGDTLSATVEIVPEPGKTLMLDRSKVRITVLAGRNAVDIRGCS